MLAYLNACCFLQSQIATFVSAIILSGIVSFDVNGEEKRESAPAATWFACLVASGLTSLLALGVFALSHRGIR